MKNHKEKQADTPQETPPRHKTTQTQKRRGARGDIPRKQGARGRRQNTAVNPMPRRACSTHHIQRTDPPTASSRTPVCRPPLRKRRCRTKQETQTTPTGARRFSWQKYRPTTTPAPAWRETVTVLARPTIRATRISLRNTAPTRRNTKNPSWLHDIALPHHNPARQAMHRSNRRGQEATHGHITRQRYLSTLPLISAW